MKTDGLFELLDTVQDERRTTHYNGNVDLYYSDELHAYYRSMDGCKVLVPSVTQVISCVDKSGPLMWWAVGSGIEHLIDNGFDQPELVRAAYYAAKNKEPFLDSVLKPVQFTCTSLEGIGKLLNDVRCAHNRISREARDTGKDVHAWLENLLNEFINLNLLDYITTEFVEMFVAANPMPKGSTVSEGELSNEERCCTAAVNWMVEHQMCPILTECKVFSAENNYAGTLDWLAWITLNGERVKVLGDFKTSKSLHDDYRLQLAAYYAALTEEFPEHLDIGASIVLRLSKDDGGFETLTVPKAEFETDLNGFYGTLQMYGWFKQLDLIKKANKPTRSKKSAGTKKSIKPIKIPEREVTPTMVG